MSCRTTAGGSVSTSLAKAVTGLKDDEIQHLFHALKREGTGMDAPSELRIAAWRSRQYDLVSRMKRMSDSRRDSMRQRLFRSQGESVPDGATFYAWENIEARARQEVALRSVATAIDLDPPGSQADQYSLGEDGRPTRVWYASYGSNMHRGRFLTYLAGGTPDGTIHPHPGARDGSDPTGDIPIRFPGRMHFAYASRRWDGGGVAFVDNDHAGHVLGRAYAITPDQFDDVVSQENGHEPGALTTPWSDLLADGQADLTAPSLYGRMVHIGDYDGAPVITFTSTFTAHDALVEGAALDRGKTGSPTTAANEPRGNYLRMMGGGLAETFGIGDHEQADYLRGAGGAEKLPRRNLLRTLRTPPEPPRPSRTEPKPAASAPSRRPAGRSSDWLAAAEEQTRRSSRLSWGPTGGKACPLCGNPGHTMHDCHLLRREDDELPLY